MPLPDVSRHKSKLANQATDDLIDNLIANVSAKHRQGFVEFFQKIASKGLENFRGLLAGLDVDAGQKHG